QASGRRAPNEKGMVAPFTATHLIRAEIAPTNTFRQVLRQIDGRLQETLGQGSFMSALAPEYSSTASSYTPVLFNWRDQEPARDLNLAGVRGIVTEYPAHASRFEVAISFEGDGARLQGSFEYPADLYDPSTVRRMGIHFNTLLAAAVAEPDSPLSSLS